MKISELNTKEFLGNAGAAANSYVLINYEDNNTNEPVTYKASLQELGKAIANDQQLYKKTQNGAVTTNVSNAAYVNTTAEQLVTASEKNILEKMTYYVTYDSQPHIKVRGAAPDSQYELLTAGTYSDSQYNSGLPVLFDSNNETLKYIGASNILKAIPLSGGDEFDPTEYTNEDDYTKLVFVNSDGNLVAYDNGSTSPLDVNAIHGSGVNALVYNLNNNELQYLDEYNMPQTITTIPFDLGAYEDPDRTGGTLMFYDNLDNVFYSYDSSGNQITVNPDPLKPFSCQIKPDPTQPAFAASVSFVCIDASGNLYALQSSDLGALEPLTLSNT